MQLLLGWDPLMNLCCKVSSCDFTRAHLLFGTCHVSGNSRISHLHIEPYANHLPCQVRTLTQSMLA